MRRGFCQFERWMGEERMGGIPMTICILLASSTMGPKRSFCSPGCLIRMLPHSLTTLEASLLGSPMSDPGLRVKVAISVTGIMAVSVDGLCLRSS